MNFLGPDVKKFHENPNISTKNQKISKAVNGFFGRDVRRSGRSDKKSAARVAHCREKEATYKRAKRATYDIQKGQKIRRIL